MITLITSISGTYFSSSLPDISFSIGKAVARVVLTLGGETVFSENLYPVGGKVVMHDLGSFVTLLLRKQLVADLVVNICESSDGESWGTTTTMSAKVVYCTCDLGDMAADTFAEEHYLTLLMGEKLTAHGRLEFLHYIGTEEALVHVEYEDRTAADIAATKIQGNANYTTIDVSPSRFEKDGTTFHEYTVTAGKRMMLFTIDPTQPDCAPVLIFQNSFGMDELAYCTGKHAVSPSFKRDAAYIAGKYRNYKVEETRTFKANTGFIPQGMAQWWDDVVRSDYIRVVRFVGGEPKVGREVTVTESKSDNDNMDDTMPSYTFSYRYAQRNHNVLDLDRTVGRIFDNTFDFTFN